MAKCLLTDAECDDLLVAHELALLVDEALGPERVGLEEVLGVPHDPEQVREDGRVRRQHVGAQLDVASGRVLRRANG